MNSPSDKNRERMDSDIIQSDLKALRESTKRNLPTMDQTAQALWEHNLRVSQEGIFMKFLHSLRQRPALATALGVLIVAAVLLAVPVSYTRTVGYEATLDLAEAVQPGLDISGIAEQFGKALDTDDVLIRAALAGSRIVARLPVQPRSDVESAAAHFAKSLTEKGVPAKAAIRPLTEQVTGNVYAMAANQIVEIRVNSEGMTDEEIENEIRAQIEAAGFEACLVNVDTSGDEKRIEIGVACDDAMCADGPMQLRVSVDGMEPPPAGAEFRQAIELRIASEGKTAEEAEAEALEHLAAMGLTDITDIDVQACDGYYRICVGAADDLPCCGGDNTNNAPKAPGTEEKTWGEMKKQFKE
ncbi:MAG: hypothetical protein KAW17_03705 [Candidatus Eisenbacteria sp.]|nr:hypothetical protein [Candidatus Eisenbacteria bacterium]